MDSAVKAYIDSLADEQTKQDTLILLAMFQRISGQEPKLWNQGTLGFGAYHYKYDTGREGDALVIGFYPRKGKITVYVMDGTARYADQLAELGKHSTTGYCIYVKQLGDVQVSVLERIIEESYRYITALSKDGPIRQILWRTEK